MDNSDAYVPKIVEMLEQTPDYGYMWPGVKVLADTQVAEIPCPVGDTLFQNRYLTYLVVCIESRCNKLQWQHRERELALKRLEYHLFGEVKGLLHDAMAAAGNDPTACRFFIDAAMRAMDLSVDYRRETRAGE